MLLYVRTGSKRARQNIKLELHNEGRLATTAGGQNSGFGLCNSKSLHSRQASLKKVASDQCEEKLSFLLPLKSYSITGSAHLGCWAFVMYVLSP